MTDALLKINAAAENLYNNLSARGNSPMTDTLLNNMERINALAEILYDLIDDNPRAQVLASIIAEISQIKQ
jgi:hypothetical protein